MKASDRGKLAVLGLVLAAVLFVSINIASNNSFRALQVDLTEGKLFTLSGETSKVLTEIDEPFDRHALDLSPNLGETLVAGRSRAKRRIDQTIEQLAEPHRIRIAILLRDEPRGPPGIEKKSHGQIGRGGGGRRRVEHGIRESVEELAVAVVREGTGNE